MATLNTVEDLIRVLDEQPEWCEALRRRLLSPELIQLPETLAKFAASTSQSLVELKEDVQDLKMGQARTETRLGRLEAGQKNAETRLGRLEAGQKNAETRLDQLEAGQKRLEAGQKRLEAGQERLEAGQEQAEFRLDQLEAGQKRLEVSVGEIKGTHARDATLREISLLAEDLELRDIRSLSRRDLIDLTHSAETHGIATNELRSFHRADVIVEAEDKEGTTHYIAVEASYTVDERDTRRALRNARLLQRFTGHQAHAVVSGVHMDNRIQATITTDGVSWYQLEAQSLEPD